MTSIIKFTPLMGAHEEGPLSYLLEIDDFNILLDCGWDEDFSLEKLQPLIKLAPQIDAVLLTYPDLYHLGALPYLIGKGFLNCPIYASMPVHKMGQMFMYDIYQSRHSYGEFDLFNLDEVDNAFDKVTQLKYSQTAAFTGKGQGIRAMPLLAGHMVGGTIWRINKDGDEDIVYAVDFNHKKERHLNGCSTSMEMLQRPSLLITDSFNACYVQERRKTRDGQLLTEMIQALRKKGNVMVAVDTAGRTLELIQLLETLWRNPDSGLGVYSIALLNHVSYNVVEFAKSQMEWMSEKIIRNFEDKRNNPFHFKHIQLCHSMADLDKLSEPKVVLCSVPDLQSGLSRELFCKWSEVPKNTIILTQRTAPGTLARKLIDQPDIKLLDLELHRRVQLQGEELEEYKVKELERRQEEQKLRELEEEGESSDSDLSETEEDTIVPGAKQQQHDLQLADKQTKSRTGFFKLTKKTYPMFPYVEEIIKWDEYGEIIDPRMFNFSEIKLIDTPYLDTPPLLAPESPVKVEEEPMDTTEPDEQETMQIPAKCLVERRSINITSRIVFIDFEGRSDVESMKKLLEKMKPRQMIIIHGNTKSTESLAQFCKSSSICMGEVFIPRIGETVDATTERHIFQVKLMDSLVSQMKFSKCKDSEIAWIDAQVKLQVVEDQDDEQSERETRSHSATLTRVSAAKTPAHKSIFFSEPKLSDLKQILIKNGFQAEFTKGVLVVNDLVAVKKTQAGMIHVEGCVSEDYYRVRKIVYDQYAIV